jgi:hypothetical protein
MEDQAYLGKEESLSSIPPSQTVSVWQRTILADSSRKSKTEISLKNIGLILHFSEIRKEKEPPRFDEGEEARLTRGPVVVCNRASTM